ncbi:uncharacterized protein TM35_000631080 [Trypanosoma theileri]|uniref:Uncharacterized protein n=1 Tax=Trypanosoma theileri TaxID=67003 RepID=A0A1X0NGG8_9TRYP|nr:uncharacterized protein TM35_000631080 [Trypanosoma theileri]ORC83608.1 hypothetical protein TM35_000631080 [Trypanosoma theileri]
MLLNSHVVALYERLSVLSTAAIQREVQAFLNLPSNNNNSSQQKQQQQLLNDVCVLLVKSGEWRRALTVASALPQPQALTLITALGLTESKTPQTPPLTETAKSINTTELHEMSNEALLRLGFALQRPQSQHKGDTTGKHHTYNNMNVQQQQQELFMEFRRRRRYKELIQCVMNWKFKGLIPSRKKMSKGIDLNDDSIRMGLDNNYRELSSSYTTTGVAASETPFNAEEALRGLIFNASSSNHWVEALRECPAFFITTLREPTAALQFLRKTSVETVTHFILFILRGGNATNTNTSSNTNNNTTNTTANVFSHPPVLAHGLLEQRVAWDTIASLLFALRPHLERERKVVKEDLLHAMLNALREEAAVIITTTTKDNSSITARERVRAATAAANDTRRQSIQSAVEGLCVCLSQRNEAQTRFIGLPLFTEIALTLRDCGIAIPSALLQCIFLCISDAQRYQRCDPSNSLSSSSLQCSAERELLMNILSDAPADRWVPGLQLLQLCSAKEDFVVSDAHLRCVLSGLQSISITRMWEAALNTAQFIMTEYHVFPDESSVEKLMLNLHAASWERAFEVVKLYEKKHIAVPSQTLRDLQVVAMKHSSWDVVLNLMQQIEESGKQQAGFMNYIYCLRAYGCAGKWKEAATLFKHMKNVQGVDEHSVYNEVTVAVPVLGMMDRQKWECVLFFVREICRQCGDELTKEGREVTLASVLLSFVHMGNTVGVASFLNTYSGDKSKLPKSSSSSSSSSSSAADIYTLEDIVQLQFPPASVEELREIVERAAQLQTLLGMEHLNAPIRLVFDLLATEQHRRHHQAEHIGHTVRNSTVRPSMYVPPQHVQAQQERLATALGEFVRRDENLFSGAAQQAVAEAMSKIGAGPAYLKAALF